jgi:CMP-N-acetylneuraminic acid synthetase
MNIIGITPARGGSKGIPKKNIKVISGKPLIAWTIESAKESKVLDRYVVSTEDEEILQVVREYSTDVIRRPLELATDEATTLSVLQHLVENIPCDIVVLLQATSPIRRPGLIDECIKEFIDNEYDSLATGFTCKYVEYGKNNLRRQDVQGFFYDDGNVYVIKADLVRSGERYGNKIGKKIISRWENIEVDDEFDFWMAEQILRKELIS